MTVAILHSSTAFPVLSHSKSLSQIDLIFYIAKVYICFFVYNYAFCMLFLILKLKTTKLHLQSYDNENIFTKRGSVSESIDKMLSS